MHLKFGSTVIVGIKTITLTNQDYEITILRDHDNMIGNATAVSYVKNSVYYELPKGNYVFEFQSNNLNLYSLTDR